MLAVAHEYLADRVLACIGVSPSYPSREQRTAVNLCEQLNVPYRLINTEEYLDPEYAANPTNRCFFCKRELYGRLRRLADEEDWHVVLDGTNGSDLGEDRPGMQAAHEHKVRSPLAELKLTKEQIRELARHLNLPVWDKPAMACLSSRVPHGTPITAELLEQIERAEDVLVEAGFRQFRVRHHGELARIELPEDEMALALQHRGMLVEQIRKTGYRFVCLDLAGFRSGSLNEASAHSPVRLTIESNP